VSGGVGLTKAATLRTLIALHVRERPVRQRVGRWGPSRDPRWTNPYYAEALSALGGGPASVVSSSLTDAWAFGLHESAG